LPLFCFLFFKGDGKVKAVKRAFWASKRVDCSGLHTHYCVYIIVDINAVFHCENMSLFSLHSRANDSSDSNIFTAVLLQIRTFF
jgi:hypothetical protein